MGSLPRVAVSRVHLFLRRDRQANNTPHLFPSIVNLATMARPERACCFDPWFRFDHQSRLPSHKLKLPLQFTLALVFL